MNDEERNELFIGDKLKNGKLRLFLTQHKLLTQILTTLIALFVFLKIYGGAIAARNFFGQEAPSGNPVVLHFDAVARHPFIALLMLVLSYIIGRVVTALITEERVTQFEENARGEIIDNTGMHGRGRIADLDELKKVFTFTGDDDTVGTIIGTHPENGKVLCKEYVEGNITDYVHQLKNDHMLLAAPSSSGKTTNFIPQNAINHMLAGHSVVTSDPSGELYSLLVPVARYLGYKVRAMILWPDNMLQSDGCDLLKPLRNSRNPESMADAFCAAILRNATGGKTDEFWNKANINLLTLVLLYVTHAKNFKPLKTMPRRDEDGNILAPSDKERVFREVAAYIEDPVALEANVEAAITKDPDGDGELLAGNFGIWKKNSQKDQICSGLATSLSIFRNKAVREFMSHDDMSVEQLVEEKTIYFIVTHPIDGEAFQSVTSLYFTTLFSELFRIAFRCPKNRLPHMVYIFLEEFQTLGLLPSLPAALDNIRKHNVGIALCTQELARVEEIYGTGTTINMLNDCLVQMCMGTNADYPGSGILTNASYFAKMSGTQTINEKYVTESRHKWIPERIQEYTVVDQSQRAQSSSADVYMTDDVYRIKGDEVLVRASMHNPVLIKRYYWKRHPLSDIVVQNKYTKEEFEMKVVNHEAHYRTGSEELFDPDIYELVDKHPKKRYMHMPPQAVQKKTGSGVSYDKFL